MYKRYYDSYNYPQRQEKNEDTKNEANAEIIVPKESESTYMESNLATCNTKMCESDNSKFDDIILIGLLLFLLLNNEKDNDDMTIIIILAFILFSEFI